jgi:hypothetical protein
VKNEALHRVTEERNVLHTIKRRNNKWVGNILRRKCLLKHVTEGRTGRRRRGRRIKQLLNDLKERSRYCKMKEEALDITV